MKNVGLITTHWDTVPRVTATSRETQLSAKAWSVYRQHGARTYRTDNSRQSCRAIVRQMLELHPTFLQIQEEMTRGKKDLRSTEAGKHVIKEVEQRILDEKEYIAHLKTRLKEVDGEEKEEIEKLITQAEALLDRYFADLEEVKHIPGWGEWTVDLVKTQGPALAGNLAICIINARSNGFALAAARSDIGTLSQHNTVLQKTAADATAATAAAAAQNAANVLPHRVAMGVASRSAYWGLEKAFEIGKWAVPKIAGAAFGG